MDITKLTDLELKALAFDLIKARDEAQGNLNTVLAEMQNRNTPEDPEEAVEVIPSESTDEEV